jgi:hypothetical protein
MQSFKSDATASAKTKVTLDEIAQARPKRGTGAPARCISHKSNILALLKERGKNGVLGSELYAQPHLYGRSPRNRISELRESGHLIEGRQHGPSDWFYCLIRDASGAKPSSDSNQATRPPIENSETEFMRRRREEQEQAVPLFSGVRP